MPYKFGEKVAKSFETIEEILTYPFQEIKNRGITKETCQTLGIRTGLSTNDGITPVAHYFPVTKNRELVGYIKVDLNKSKKEKGRFTTIGKVNIECDMLGTANCQNKKALKLFVVEGVYDWPSLYQTLYDLQRTKGQYIPNVVSIPLGTANALESVTNNQQLFSNYKDIVLVFDSDKATPREKSQGILKGIDAVEEVVRFFPNYLYVNLTRKDPNEYIAPFEMTGQNPDPRSLFNETLFHAKKYEPDDFIEGPISADELYEPLKEGVPIKCLPKMSQMLHGFRKKELTLLLSPAGTGKTTALTEIGYDLLKHSNYKVDYIYAEEDVKKAQQRFIAIDNNIRLDKFRLNPAIIPLEERERTRTELLGGGRTAWLDTKASFGRLDPDRLIRRLQWSAAKGFDFVFIDHLTMMLYGKHSEVKDIDDLLVRLAEHIVSTEQGIIAVSHITRRNRPAPKDEDGNVKYPHWQEVQKEDARGCLDKDTEFLTPAGWKRISEYTADDLVAEYNNGGISFQKPKSFIKLACKDGFNHFKNKNTVDMMLSDEHRVLVLDAGSPSIVSAAELEDNLWKRYELPIHFTAGQTCVPLTDEMIRVATMIAADGCYHGSGLCKLNFLKKRKIRRAHKLLKAAGIEYSCTKAPKKGDTTFRFKAPLKEKALHACTNWYAATSGQLAILLDECIHWDGSDKGAKGLYFYSAQKADCDVVQFAAHATNRRATINKRDRAYEVCISRLNSVKSKVYLREHIKTERVKSKDGFKYCFETSSGFFLARRNGKIFITGNSGAFEQLGWNIICVEPEILENKQRGRIRFRIDKNREYGTLGLADIVRMDSVTGRLVDAGTDEPDHG